MIKTRRILGIFLLIGLISFVSAEQLKVNVYSSGSTISDVLVTIRNLNYSVVQENITDYSGATYFTLNPNDYIINLTKGGYFINSTIISFIQDSEIDMYIGTYDSIEVSSSENLHNLYTRIDYPGRIINLSDSINPCRYSSLVNIYISKNGNLNLDGCTLEMNSSDVTRRIRVDGQLTANNVNITRVGNTNYWFYTNQGCNLTLKNSFVSYAGDNDVSTNRRGLEIACSNLDFDNNTFDRNKGIVLLANNLTLKKLKMTTTSSYNIQNYGNNNILVDSGLSGATVQDVKVHNNHIILRNTNHTTQSVINAGRLQKQWYVGVKVNNSQGLPLEGATITFKNKNGVLVATALTDSSGEIGTVNITAYNIYSSGMVTENDYTINVQKTGYVQKNLIKTIYQSETLPIVLEPATQLKVNTYAAGSTISNINVSVRYPNHTFIISNITDYNGQAYFNLPKGYYLINFTKPGYFFNYTYVNLTEDMEISQTLTLLDSIEVSSTETLEQLYSRISQHQVWTLMENLSDSSEPCAYTLHYNLFISKNGKLIINNCKVISDADYHRVEMFVDGVIVINNSNFTRRNGYGFTFDTKTVYPSTRVDIQNSHLNFFGDVAYDGYRGISLRTSNVTFKGNKMWRSYDAHLEIFANNIVIENTEFLDSNTVTWYNIFNYANNTLVINSNLAPTPAASIVMRKNTNITLLNTNHTNTYGEPGSKLYKKWTVRVKAVNPSGGAIMGANITLFNNSGGITHSALTGFIGYTPYLNITEYISNGTARFYQTNYTISGFKEFYNSSNLSINITTPQDIILIMSPTSGGCPRCQIEITRAIKKEDAVMIKPLRKGP